MEQIHALSTRQISQARATKTLTGIWREFLRWGTFTNFTMIVFGYHNVKINYFVKNYNCYRAFLYSPQRDIFKYLYFLACVDLNPVEQKSNFRRGE